MHRAANLSASRQRSLRRCLHIHSHRIRDGLCRKDLSDSKSGLDLGASRGSNMACFALCSTDTAVDRDMGDVKFGMSYRVGMLDKNRWRTESP